MTLLHNNTNRLLYETEAGVMTNVDTVLYCRLLTMIVSMVALTNMDACLHTVGRSCLASFPGLLTPAVVACSTNAGYCKR